MNVRESVCVDVRLRREHCNVGRDAYEQRTCFEFYGYWGRIGMDCSRTDILTGNIRLC
jgi:hypothetical protein